MAIYTFGGISGSSNPVAQFYTNYLGEGFRGVLGDEYLSRAGGWELTGVVAAGVTAGVLGGWVVAPAGATGWAALGYAALAGGVGGGAEYLAMTGTAAALNQYHGYGANVGPTFSGLATSVVFGAAGGGIFHGAGLGARALGNAVYGAVDAGLDAGARAIARQIMGNAALQTADGFVVDLGNALARAGKPWSGMATNGFGPGAAIGGVTGNHLLFSVGRRGAKGVRHAAELRPYGGPGGGHHVPAKSGFQGASDYNAIEALAIPNSELTRLGVRHELVTGAQITGYRAFAQTGKTLTWKAMAQIETQALIRGGMNAQQAVATVQKAIQALKSTGVKGPTRIPWGG